MRAGELTPYLTPYTPTAIRREGPALCLGKTVRVGPDDMSEGDPYLKTQEQENCPHSLMPAALGELAGDMLESLP